MNPSRPIPQASVKNLVLRKTASKSEFTIAKFNRKLDFTTFTNPITLRQKNLQDEEADLAESNFEDIEDKKQANKPEQFYSEKEKEKMERDDQYAAQRRLKRLQKKQEFIIEDASGKCRFEGAAEATQESRYALFITNETGDGLYMIPVTNQWFQFKPKPKQAAKFSTESAEKFMNDREKKLQKKLEKADTMVARNEGIDMNTLTALRAGGRGRKKVKEEAESMDYEEEFADDEDQMPRLSEKEMESSDDEDELANGLFGDSEEKLSENGKMLKKLLKKEEDPDAEDSDEEEEKKEEKPTAVDNKEEKKKDAKAEEKPTLEKKDKKKDEKKKKEKKSTPSSPAPDAAATTTTTTPPATNNVPSAVKQEKKKTSSPDGSTSSKKRSREESAKEKKPKKQKVEDVPESRLKEEVIKILQARGPIRAKEMISLFITNIKREPEEKKTRYALFGAILKEVAEVQEINSEKYVVLKKK
ncbi:transcription initiation factor IIF subunit alpha [Acrasis kona]|uniref:Transcription initiation factor IIF subunit alpha n=1 Tax=Acrasis kona TaxID=1008807 RepID=A0AAW2Z208_9EUKA